MSAADWEEIRALAADFQRAQLSSTVQRLSERNCIEIVNKLIELKLINIIYTQDGKEYITPEQLEKDITDELYVRGGRISLGELQQITNVDFTHVEKSAKQIATSGKNVDLVFSDLINGDYKNKLACEINDQLQEQGHVTISELAKIYDLPGTLLSQIVQQNLGTLVKAYQDNANTDYLYTEFTVQRYRAKIRGLFSAITQPTQLSGLRNKLNMPKDLFYVILEKLISTKRLKGTVYGGRSDKATYNPDIYSRTQNEWVDSFYRSNGYLEYDALTRLGITDPQGFIRRRYPQEHLSFLESCCAGDSLQVQLEGSVEEAVNQGSWVDVMPLLPSTFTDTDASTLLTMCLKNHPSATLLCDTIVMSAEWLKKCRGTFDELVSSKAQKDVVANPAIFQDANRKSAKSDETNRHKEQKKDQRRKKAAAGSGSTKSGGGTQGREIRTKSTKKKGAARYQQDDHDDSDEDFGRVQNSDVEFMSIEEIETVLRERNDLSESTDELFTEIATLFYRPLSKLYLERATALFLSSSGAATGADRRKTHEERQEKISGLWTNVKLFEKGIKIFSGKDDIETQLVKHLLKTVCTSIVNHVAVAMATDHMISIPNDADVMTIEMRQKLISSIPEPSQSILAKLNSSVNGKDLEAFYESLDAACDSKHLGILLRPLDKKKERPLIQSHRESLKSQLDTDQDAAMTLHLAVTLLFLHFTHTMIHAPGRCIPGVISHLCPFMEADSHAVLVQMQELVIMHLKAGDQSEDKERLTNEMTALMPKVKDIAMTPAKAALNNENV